MYPCLMISNGPDVVHPRRGHCLWRIRRLGQRVAAAFKPDDSAQVAGS